MGDEGTSLQDLIDSELALRISTDTIEDEPDCKSDSPPFVPEITKVTLLDLKIEDDSSARDESSEGFDDSTTIGCDVPSLDSKVEDLDLLDSIVDQLSPTTVLNNLVDNSAENLVDNFVDNFVDNHVDNLEDNLVDNVEENSVENSVDKMVDIVEVSMNADTNLLGLDVAGECSPDSGQREEIPEAWPGATSPGATSPGATSPPIKSPDDVNTQFIVAEQRHQMADLTEADILFYNTFNQVQSNGDDFLSSPEAANDSPGQVRTSEFNPFATLPSQDLESPLLEVPGPFPDTIPDNNIPDVVDTVVDDINSCEVDVDNRMSVLTVVSSVELTSPDSSAATSVREEVLIPEIGVTPPEPGSEYNEDEYYRTLEASREESLSESEKNEGKEEFDSWTKVSEVEFDRSEATQEEVEVELSQSSTEEIVGDRSQASDIIGEHDVCVNSAMSDSESCDTMSSSVEKKTTKKKKSETGETTTTVRTKRNKKTKKEEKENISVVDSVTTNGLTPTSPNSQPSEVLLEDARDLSNVSVKELKQTYCNGAMNGYHRDVDPPREKYATGVSIKELRRSFGDLTNLVDKDELQDNSKSSFSKFDALSKKSVLHVRSGDAAKAQKQFSQASSGEVNSDCKACGKQVFQMEQVKAERCVWHKNCFRCKECNKQLTVDIYSSHEGVVYCKPHFKDLFKPKAVVEDDTPIPRRRKAGPIISENQPTELPPDIVRGSDKPDLGLEELSSCNVKSRFQAFEQKAEEENSIDRSPSTVNVKRSPSILSKLARFQAKGMDVGVTDDSLNGVPLNDETSSEEEEEEREEGERDVVRANRKQRERPVSFNKMEDIKGRWETGTALSKEERREERKLEISTIRSRLFQGHQGKMKEAYQQAVSESTTTTAAAKKDSIEVGSDRARSIKERFERGDVANLEGEDEQKKMIDEDLVDAGYTKKSRSLFLEMDATAAKCAPVSPVKPGIGRDESFRRPKELLAMNRQTSEDVVRASDAVEDVQVETADIGNKFKFFETFKPTEREKRTFRITPPREGTVKGKSPEREIYRDPTIVRADDRLEEQEVMRSQTASKMLSFFKNMEESATKEDIPTGPKPLKRFTPPPDCEIGRDSGSSEEEESDEEEEEEDDEHNPDIIRSSDKVEDEFLKQSQSAAVHAKALRAKFERWEEQEVEKERSNILNGLEQSLDQSDQTSLDTTKSLRARFESLNNEPSQNKDKLIRPKVNRFV